MVVGVFVGVFEFLFVVVEVVYFVDNFVYYFFDFVQFGFYGFQFFVGLDGSLVFGVGINVNVEFDVMVGVLDVFVCWLRVSGVFEDQRLVDVFFVRMFLKYMLKVVLVWEVKMVCCLLVMFLGLLYLFFVVFIMCMFSCMLLFLYLFIIVVIIINMFLVIKF